jgi:CelD/BcsL family acetyltransferase involved in cellulose biosynthesis
VSNGGDLAPRNLQLDRACSLRSTPSDWNDLARRSKNVFSTPEWATVWWRHFGGDRPLVLIACRDSDGLVAAILPLYLWSTRPMRVARLIGHGPADQLAPICAPHDRPATAAALRQALVDIHCHVFFGDELQRNDGWSGLLHGNVHSCEASPVLPLGSSSWDEFLASRSANFRSQLGRRERAVSARGFRFRLATDSSRLASDLDLLFALHRARWRDEASAFGRMEAFHREFAALAFDRGWLRLWFLEHDGTAVAAWYGFRYSGVEAYYQAGRDPAWERFGVGFVLLAHSIREAMADGMDEYRFGRGNEPYKHRFAASDPGLETVWLARGVGRLAMSAGEALRRPARLRRLLGSRLRRSGP